MNSAQWHRMVDAFVEALQRDAAYLDELDAATGDGEHGTTMRRAFEAVKVDLDGAFSRLDSESSFLKAVGTALSKAAGGAAGALYSAFFSAMGQAAGAEQQGDPAARFVVHLDAGVQAVCRLGKAQVGDKTMVDALVPALEAARAASARGAGLGETLDDAAAAARAGMLRTRDMMARRGRASYLGERALGHQDPGATSAYMILDAMRSGFHAGE